jgi:hypothetical protein
MRPQISGPLWPQVSLDISQGADAVARSAFIKHLYLFSFELPVTRYLLQFLAIVGVCLVLLEIGRLCVGDMMMDGQQPFGIYYLYTYTSIPKSCVL